MPSSLSSIHEFRLLSSANRKLRGGQDRPISNEKAVLSHRIAPESRGHLPTYSSSSPRLSLTFAALTTLTRADVTSDGCRARCRAKNGIALSLGIPRNA